MTTLQEPETVTMTSFLPYYGENPKETAKQAKLQSREQAKQAKLQEREQAKQAKLQSREQAKQTKMQEREQAKQTKMQEREQARVQTKQAKMLAKLQERDQARSQAKQEKKKEREAIKKRKERVKEIKKQQRQQLITTERLFRGYRAREREIARARRDAARRERETEERHLREEAAALVARENTNRARIEREERHMRRLRGMVLDADLTEVELVERLGRGLPMPQLARRNRDRRREYQHRGAVNPMQELINQDQIDCNKTREELILVENAFEVTDCPICFDELGNTNQMILRCGHKVCGDCIMEHMPRVGGLKCPICREQYGVRINGWAPPLPRR